MVAAETAAYLRLDAGRHPGDPRLAALVDELSRHSKAFCRLWARQEVREKTYGPKLIRHPLAGELEFQYETLALPDDRDQLLVAYGYAPDSPTAERIGVLAGRRSEQLVTPSSG